MTIHKYLLLFTSVLLLCAAAIEKNQEKVIYGEWSHGSLMFDQDTEQSIINALISFKTKLILGNIEPTPTIEIDNKKKQVILEIAEPDFPAIEQQYESYPQTAIAEFYLNSILYFSPNQWSIWVNDKKISSTKPKKFNNLSIVKVLKKEVFFIWRNSWINLAKPDWRNNFIQMGDYTYISSKKNIIINTKTGDISFSLHPNQSFLLDKLQIIEGTSKDYTKDNTRNSYIIEME